MQAAEVRALLRDVFEDGVISLAADSDLLGGYVIRSVGREVGNLALAHRGPDSYSIGLSNRRGFDATCA